MTGCHRTSRPATELGMRALSHPDCIPDTFEAVGLRQPILVPTALRSVSDGGGGGDFRFLATTERHAETNAGQSSKAHFYRM